jgi:FdhD protein
MKPQAATESRYVLRWQADSTPARVKDELAVEEPLEIQVDTHSVVVTMRTPGHDDELAAGFLLTEGLIKSAEDILKIVPYVRNLSGNVLDVFLAAGVTVDFAQLTRHVFASSSCGLCGKATIESVQRRFKRIRSKARIAVAEIARLPEELRRGQSTFDATGGLHAAGLFSTKGELLVLREDVGRHNAVDKVLGHALLKGWLPLDDHVLVVSGRTSFEIVQKALAARVPIIAAVSAPSSLAVQFAVENGQTLVGFVRGNRLNVYSHPDRIEMPTRSVRTRTDATAKSPASRR